MRIGGNLTDVGTAADTVGQQGADAAAAGETFGLDSDQAVLDIDTVWGTVRSRFDTLLEDSRTRLQTQRDALAGVDAEGGSWQAINDANAAQEANLTTFGEQAAADMDAFRAALTDWATQLQDRVLAVKASMTAHDEHCQSLAGSSRAWALAIEDADNQVLSTVPTA